MSAAARAVESSWKNYLYEDASTLVNKAGLKDPLELAQFERRATASRAVELELSPVMPTFNVPHVQEIHRRLFQDVYDWAGQFRTVDMTKDGVSFAPIQHARFRSLAAAGDAVLQPLQGGLMMEGLHKDAFIHRFTAVADAMNYWHPFREGNGRTARIFLSQLAEHGGYTLDFSRVNAEHWNRAFMVSAAYRDILPLRNVVREITTSTRALAFAQATKANDFNSALEQHPELRPAVQTLQKAKEHLNTSGDSRSHEARERDYQSIVVKVQRELDAGHLPPPATYARVVHLLRSTAGRDP